MGYTELEVEVTLANAAERRRIWVSAIPGIRPGRRLRVDGPDTTQWWRIIEVGQLRLREAAATFEIAT
ncbi:MAG: hypothetical protein ACR2P0_12355 [Acidimicrobiales bacterium]